MVYLVWFSHLSSLDCVFFCSRCRLIYACSGSLQASSPPVSLVVGHRCSLFPCCSCYPHSLPAGKLWAAELRLLSLFLLRWELSLNQLKVFPNHYITHTHSACRILSSICFRLTVRVLCSSFAFWVCSGFANCTVVSEAFFLFCLRVCPIGGPCGHSSHLVPLPLNLIILMERGGRRCSCWQMHSPSNCSCICTHFGARSNNGRQRTEPGDTTTKHSFHCT